MPEHFHLLIWPSEPVDPSQIIQSLKERTAIFILENLRENRQLPWCRKMLERLTLPLRVHHHGRVAQTVPCDFCGRGGQRFLLHSRLRKSRVIDCQYEGGTQR
jgi:hypothetical protein